LCSAGINFNDGFGGADDLSHNLVFSTCRESGDHGPFNSWDRQPYLTTVRTGEPSVFPQWRDIHHNFFLDNYSPEVNVDNDDGSAYYHTRDNFLVYGGMGMKTDFGGHDNHHFGNIYAYVGHSVSVTSDTLEGHEDYFYGNKIVMTSTDLGRAQCADPKTQMHDNQYFASGNLTLCGVDLAQAQSQLGMETGSTDSPLPTDDAILGWATELLQIQSNIELVV